MTDNNPLAKQRGLSDLRPPSPNRRNNPFAQLEEWRLSRILMRLARRSSFAAAPALERQNDALRRVDVQTSPSFFRRQFSSSVVSIPSGRDPNVLFDNEDHLADWMAFFHEVQSFRRLFQRKGLTHMGFDLASGHKSSNFCKLDAISFDCVA